MSSRLSLVVRCNVSLAVAGKARFAEIIACAKPMFENSPETSIFALHRNTHAGSTLRQTVNPPLSGIVHRKMRHSRFFSRTPLALSRAACAPIEAGRRKNNGDGAIPVHKTGHKTGHKTAATTFPRNTRAESRTRITPIAGHRHVPDTEHRLFPSPLRQGTGGRKRKSAQVRRTTEFYAKAK